MKRPIPALNAAWHKRHPMPRNPALEERIAWHLEHQEQCRCRPMPAKLLEQMSATQRITKPKKSSR
ncbi:MAG: hypothetical protein ACYC8T_30500 [Myxococcaceae bacterium]